MSDAWEHLTDAELAMEVYLAIIKHDDSLPDDVFGLFQPALRMASALRQRLVGPYCAIDGCGEPHTDAYPWCPTHLAERFPS